MTTQNGKNNRKSGRMPPSNIQRDTKNKRVKGKRATDKANKDAKNK